MVSDPGTWSNRSYYTARLMLSGERERFFPAMAGRLRGSTEEGHWDSLVREYSGGRNCSPAHLNASPKPVPFPCSRWLPVSPC